MRQTPNYETEITSADDDDDSKIESKIEIITANKSRTSGYKHNETKHDVDDDDNNNGDVGHNKFNHPYP